MNARRRAWLALSLVAVTAVVFVLAPSGATAKGGAALEVVPLVLIHGHGADPAEWGPFLERYGRGRAVVTSLCAADAERLAPGSLPRACVIAASYYRDTATGTEFDPDASGRGQGSIGGCPVPRDDGYAGRYPISYAKRIARIVEGVRRAAGSERVDIAMHSMGNLVGRSYTKWFSVGGGGKSRVRRLLCIAGPHRGVNAFEAMVDGLEHHGARDFMLLGELAEMCSDYQGWHGESFTHHLNNGWDDFCAACDVQYAGITGTGAFGKQVDPSDPTDKDAPRILGWKTAGPIKHIVRALLGTSGANWPDAKPFFALWGPHVIRELHEALGPGDGVVRLVSSRLDQDPFHRAATWATFEGRHGDNWNPEQSTDNSTFATELAGQFLYRGRIARGGQVDRCELRPVNAPGRASWLALETTVSGAPLVSAQVVEEKLKGNGKPDGPAFGYGCPLPQGEQRAFIPVPPGGGTRRYHVVLYGPTGPVRVVDALTFTLADGTPEDRPFTTLRVSPPAEGATDRLDDPKDPGGAPESGRTAGPVVHVTAETNTAADGGAAPRFSFRFDDGAWTAFAERATFVTPPLTPGEHRLEARARNAANAAHVTCDDAQGAALGILVDERGAVTTR